MTRRAPLSTLFPYTTLFRSGVMVMVGLLSLIIEPSYLQFVRRLVFSSLAPPVQALQISTRSEEHTSELQSLRHLVCRLLLEKKKHGKHMHCFYVSRSYPAHT